MLKTTFQCFDGIGESGECKLWERGCLCWQDFLNGAADFLSSHKQQKIFDQIEEAQIALANGMADWFLCRLKGAAQLRVLYDFWEQALFLDIETTGLERTTMVTSIASWKNGKIGIFVKGFNFTDFLHELASAPLLVTFNGEKFDLPLLRRRFRINLAQPHLDLLYPLRSLGYRGGLKRCEKQLNFQRRFSEGNTGEMAIRLWLQWQKTCNREALKKLLLYNVEDVYSMVYMSAKLLPQSMLTYPLTPKCSLPPRPVVKPILEKFAL